MPWCVWAQPLHGIRRIFRQFALPRWALVITFTHLENKNRLIFLQHLSSNVAAACPPAPKRKCAFDWWVWLNKDKILNAWPYVCRMHCLFWLRAWKLNLNLLMSSSCCQGRGRRWRWATGEGGGGVDFRATGWRRGAIMSARGCLGCKLLPWAR